MADLALVYSKTALDIVVNKVQTAIKEEEQQWQTVQRDLEFIMSEFEMMQSFLNTADGARLKSLVVRTWVQQVRDLSYDVEDSIEFVLKLDSSKRPWWLRLLPSWMKIAPEAPVDEAVTEITKLKARVVDVSKRNTRYNLVTDSSAKPGAYHRVLGVSNINPKDFPDLRKCFRVHNKSLRVICVLSGTVGDLGTLVFIRRLYDDRYWRFARRAWVKLMQPFNPYEFIRCLLAQFLRSSCKAEGQKILGVEVLKMEEIQLIDQFVHLVNTHNYFIVLEGVSSMEQWDAIKTYLPDRMNKSRIIVWTHRVEIATRCTGLPYRAFVIRQSSPDHPSYVFYREDSEARSDDGSVSESEEYNHNQEHEEEQVFVWDSPGSGKQTAQVNAVHDHVRGIAGSDYCGENEEEQANFQDSEARSDLPLSEDKDEFELSRLLSRPRINIERNRSFDDDDFDLSSLLSRPRINIERSRPFDDEDGMDSVGSVFEREELESKYEEESVDMRRKETEELLKVVMDKKVRRLAVWGPPGVGKTALVRAVYNQVQGLDESAGGFTNRGWANVPDPFVDVVGVSRDLFSELKKNGLNNLASSITYCLKYSQGRTLVVLDGVKSKEDWDQIHADITCAMQPGSCVVVITGDESIAAHCVGRSDVDRVLRINPLGAAAALGIFMEKARVSNEEGNLLVEECRSLSSKCGGLPIFIVTIARYLAKQNDSARRITEMRLMNENFIHQLKNNPKFDCLKYVLAWLHSKFDVSPQLLKKCIFYLSLFPRDRNIRRKRLVRRWIAEGFCSGTNCKVEAENLIGKVGELCLFQTWETVIPVPGSMIKTLCLVNSAFLDYIISRQAEEKTFLPLEISVLDGRCSPPTNRVGQHLAIGSDWVRDEAAYISLDFSRLRSLTASGKWDPFFISQKMRVLRVLDLEGTCNLEDDDLDEIGELMPRLKFLSLRQCKPISRLPESLGDLLLLETLDIRHTSIVVLPKKITKLQKLQHIRAGETHGPSDPHVPTPVAAPTPAISTETPVDQATPSQPDEGGPRHSRGSKLSARLSKLRGSVAGYRTGGIGVPRGMGGMKVLHTLGVVDVDVPGGKALLAELMKKKKTTTKKKGVESHTLRNLSLCGLDWSRHLLHCISRLDQLESLSLWAEKLQVQHFNLPPNLVKFSLDVAGILHQGAVDAIKDHKKLQTLRLQAKKVEGGTVSFSGATNDGESVGGSFDEVKVLEISCSSSLHVMFSQQGMQNLELLKVHFHSGSSSEISGLEQLGVLKQVWVIGSCDDTLKEALRKQLSEHRNKPALFVEERGFFQNVMEE